MTLPTAAAFLALLLPTIAGAQASAPPPEAEAPADPGQAEPEAEAKSQAQAAAPLSFSGYIQARYGWSTLQNRHGFALRRGRLKATYDLDWSRYVLQVDATPAGLKLKDAEVHLVEPWTGHGVRLVVGQTKWPFGYEVGQSSSRREFPERSQAVRAFAPGERDLGAKVLAEAGVIRFMGGIFNGNGLEHVLAGEDNDPHKDVVARLGVDLGAVKGGISGWSGLTLGILGSPPPLSDPAARTRLGADLQVSGELLPLGETVLRAEAIWGRTPIVGGVEQFDRTAFGWYAVLVQDLGEKVGFAARFDFFDRRLGTAEGAGRSLSIVGAALMYHWSPAVELTAAFESPVFSGPPNPMEPQLTLQAQAKF